MRNLRFAQNKLKYYRNAALPAPQTRNRAASAHDGLQVSFYGLAAELKPRYLKSAPLVAFREWLVFQPTHQVWIRNHIFLQNSISSVPVHETTLIPVEWTCKRRPDLLVPRDGRSLSWF